MSVYAQMNAYSSSVYPISAPGMPFPGTDFVRMASELGGDVDVQGKGKNQSINDDGTLQKLVHEALYSGGDFKLNFTVKGTKRVLLDVVSGHLWGAPLNDVNYGPSRAEVMVVGKMLGNDDLTAGRHLYGPGGKLLLDSLKKFQVRPSKWYVTSLMKCGHPTNDDTQSAAWGKQFLHLLHQELRIVRPKYLLCLGVDAGKALFGPKFSLNKAAAAPMQLDIPIHRSADEVPEYHTIKVMCCLNPGAVIRAPDLGDRFEQALGRFVDLTNGLERTFEEGLDHRIVTTEAGIDGLVDEVINDPDSYQSPLLKGQPKTALIAVDAEWHGEHPQNEGSYVRTVQISWAHKKAACVVLTHPGGEELRPGWIERCVDRLNKILKSTKERLVRPTMHFGTADLEWLVPLGIDIRHEYQAPTNWKHCKYVGGFDTGMAAHALEETGDFSLKLLSLRMTEAPVYETALDEWRAEFCKTNGINSTALEGYGECPIEILGPYGNYDADVSRRIAVQQMTMLGSDKFGNDCWKAFWTSQRILLPILEMNQTGLLLDMERTEKLIELYTKSREGLRAKIREWANWPELNLDSAFQVRELLFGEEHNGKERKDNPAVPVRLRPAHARTMGLRPILTTGKRPKEWVEVEELEEEDEHVAATSRAVLSILARGEAVVVHRDEAGNETSVSFVEQVGWIRDFRYVSQVLKSVLRGPKTDKKTGEILTNSEGEPIYDGGFLKHVCDDGRLRAHLYPTKETYRWSAARPNLQAISKRREADYKRILGKDYLYPIRSVLRAPPGYVLIESDYIGAELFGMAVLSGDPTMIDHCMRNQLSEHDPNYYDIHSNIAVSAFRLDCAPTKQGLEDIGRVELRIAAKSVLFGIGYGRSPKAVAVALREEGVNVTEDEATKIGELIFNMYPGLEQLFEDCRVAAIEQHFICGIGGQYRRFAEVPPNDRKLRGEMERQGMNFPFQNMIAWACDRAVDNVYSLHNSRGQGIDYRGCLQIHDALLFLVLGAHAERFTTEVLRPAMVDMVPVTPNNLDGSPRAGAKTYRLGVEYEAAIYWGEVPKPNELLEIGCSPTLAHWEKSETVENGWVHGKFKLNKNTHRVWVDDGWIN